MRAMVLKQIGLPLILEEVPIPKPGPYEVLIRVLSCGVCRTDLHIIEGDLSAPYLPLILGHQIVGVIEEVGEKVSHKYSVGTKVGVPWLGGTCHSCEFCLSERENLCDLAIYTGYLKNGGFAEYCTALEAFILPIPSNYDNLHTAPLLCAGLIGYRALKKTGFAKKIGFYGFGSSAHLNIQIAISMGIEVYVFTRPGHIEKQEFAKSLGAKWVGGSDEKSPELLDAAIIFAPDGSLYPIALQATKKGGTVISAGIHMSDIPSFSYDLLWGERSISSVANLTRQDGIDFMKLAEKNPLHVEVSAFSLEQANEALALIKSGTLEGSAVLLL